MQLDTQFLVASTRLVDHQRILSAPRKSLYEQHVEHVADW